MILNSERIKNVIACNNGSKLNSKRDEITSKTLHSILWFVFLFFRVIVRASLELLGFSFCKNYSCCALRIISCKMKLLSV